MFITAFTEDMFRITPPRPAAISRRATAWVAKKAAFRFTPIT